MSDSYQLWRVEAPRHRDLTFVLFHRHSGGGTCSLPSIFKEVGTAMTLSEGYYTNQRLLRDACHVYHWLHLTRLMCACIQPKGAGIRRKNYSHLIIVQWYFVPLYRPDSSFISEAQTILYKCVQVSWKLKTTYVFIISSLNTNIDFINRTEFFFILQNYESPESDMGKCNHLHNMR